MTPETLCATFAKAFSDARGWSAAEFASLIAQPDVIVKGDARSFVMLRIAADEAEVLTLATDPAHRRQGLARAAMTAGHAGSRARGATSVFLEVADDNAVAKALYASLGYTQVGRRAAYYKRSGVDPVAAVVLRCDLNSA